MPTTTYMQPAKTGLNRILASRLVDSLTAPHGVERYMALVNPLWSLEQVRARVETITPETPDCATLTLRPNDNWQDFAAGQYVQVGVEIDGVRRTRCFSLSGSTQRADGLITVTVKAHEGGHVSRYLVEKARPGEVLELSQAMGEFTLPADEDNPLLLISGGSGITPVMSMLRSLTDAGSSRPIIFMHYARDYENATFRDELQAIAENHANVRVVWALTRGEPQGDDLAGHFDAAHVERIAPIASVYQTYACGPAPLIEAVQAHWQGKGWDDRLQVEYFKAAPVTQPDNPDDITGEVYFTHSERVTGNSGETLLEQAEAAGLTPDYGCRMGICQTCTCCKTAGTVRNVHTGELNSDTDTEIQICVNAPVGDVTLDL